jgi:hypothetical protein
VLPAVDRPGGLAGGQVAADSKVGVTVAGLLVVALKARPAEVLDFRYFDQDYVLATKVERRDGGTN